MESKPAQIVYRTFRENARDKKPLRHPKTPEGKKKEVPRRTRSIDYYTRILYRTPGDNARLNYALFSFCINKSFSSN